jgi:hypothetical protein
LKRVSAFIGLKPFFPPQRGSRKTGRLLTIPFYGHACITGLGERNGHQ